MVNSKRLRGKMAEAGLNQKCLARIMGLSENTMSAKINGKSRVYLDEADELCEILSIVDPKEKAEIFLQRTSLKGDEIA